MAEYKNFETYLKQDHHQTVKENFKRLAELLFDKLNSGGDKHLLDAGCATGALIGYLKQLFPQVEMTGLDISEELLSQAREKLPQETWLQGNVLALSENWSDQFDVSLLIGVLGVFDEDDAQVALNELIRCTQKGGEIYVFAQFNEFDVDMLITHRKHKQEQGLGDWEKGWNIYSEKTITHWVENRVASVEFIDFKMPFELEPQEDPVRTWTISTEENQHQLTNGMKLLVDLKFLKITV